MIVGIYSSNTTEATIDIEHAEYEEMSINVHEAYISYKEIEQTGVLVMGNSKYTVSITMVSEKSELIKVAENIK